MTAFARAAGSGGGVSHLWELKSVNGKGLDLRLRLPSGYDHLDTAVRATIGRRLRRGNVSVTLTIDRVGGAAGFRVNREALAQVVALARELATELDVAAPRLDGLLAIRGVLESGEAEETPAERETRSAGLLASCECALDQLVAMREAEGARLAEVIATRLDEISAFVRQAEASAAAQPDAAKARLQALLAALLEASPPIPEERLAQEVALVVARADIREELDRLAAHVDAARALLMEGTAIGRRFDFLCQELNREANTLCSKSADLDLTRIGLALKAAIEQLREQVQNVE